LWFLIPVTCCNRHIMNYLVYSFSANANLLLEN
jgi:hypothetical protein